MKTCKTCSGEFPETMFYKHSQRGKSFQSSCMSCHKDLVREHHLRNKEMRNMKKRADYLAVSLDFLLDWMPKQLVVQNNLCAICKSPDLSGKGLCIDHDHTTGKLRGLLCSSCNLALGGFKDSPELLNSAIDYLS